MSEYAHVEAPLLTQLGALGWTVVDQGSQMIPHSPAASLRSSFRDLILPQVFRDSVRALNQTSDGQDWLTERQLAGLIDDIFRQPGKGLLDANEAVHALLMKAQVDRNEVTGEKDPTVRLIDFANPERNTFHAINQFRVDTPGCIKAFIIPDVVLFVNGIPLVVIEAKIGDANTANPMHGAFVQLQRYRDARPETARAGLREGEPKLFYPNLMVIRTCGEAAEFGSISSAPEHFYRWRNVWPEQYATITPPLGVVREQEELVQGLLNPHCLLDILRTCTVFKDTDSGKRVKVLARYQQHRAARRIVERLRTGQAPMERSGVIWHTQGSGKSLTMVFVGRMLRASRDLNDMKILMVVDRADLEDQLTGTARLIGGKINLVESRAAVRDVLSSPASDVNMVMVHKFLETKDDLPDSFREKLGRYAPPPSAESFGVVNASERILIMVDEAHRTQGSDMGDNLFEAFPNAARVAFTGTPLITERHAGRQTVKRFGEYIDKYKLMDAVADGATLQILYEGRTANTALRDKAEFDQAFEDLFAERSAEDLLAIKKKYGATGDILEAESRIGAIARDLVGHYIDNILPNGFKAQVVCHSKLAAVRYQRALREALAERLERETDPEAKRRIAFLKVAVVVSSDATNESAEITAARREARESNAVENFCKPFNLDDYDQANTGIAFLVVCDMLLTGFDAPIEQVMYIDKRLKEHNLLQAIARVNRVTHGKQRGFIVDYIGFAGHLTAALKIYADQEPEDLKAGFQNLTSELPILEERYRRLLQHFQGLGVHDIEAFLTGTLASPEDDVRVVHKAVDALERIKARADFEVYLKKFLMSLDLILPGAAAHRYRGPARRLGYLMRMAKERFKDDSIDFAGVGQKVAALINKHLIELGVDPQIPPVELLDPDFVEQVTGHAQGSTRAKASEMEHAIRKHCTIHFDEDPAFFKRMSEKLDTLIAKHGDDWKLLAEAYEGLRADIRAGRGKGDAEQPAEVAVFKDNLFALIGDSATLSLEDAAMLDALSSRLVSLIRDAIAIVDFWRKPDQVRRLRANIDTELMVSGISAVQDHHQRIAVELTKLAEKRHVELLRP
ncbi:deoxyribonuclease HsdR [Sphingopyxis terrae subsp. terrae NBRC 15098]|uniref:Type I restriction enzyme endonuclease subunit n=1 Tax=Sphingopyxis terrae subsp. terrae NBRC 15098 TaxID=1219058 RepID=A0A142VTI4_9SPHN|nr:HsdR family type I site-specific deoxyribonuclease [Sphingopyxis terrae]AMU93100.1 deoxyribonuclease HsdR [Sphingopyxis terrae subsp. terrae NBRC 15098]